MKKRKRFKSAKEEREALRREPVFQELLRGLKSQTPGQIDRLEDWLAEEIEREEAHGCKEDKSPQGKGN